MSGEAREALEGITRRGELRRWVVWPMRWGFAGYAQRICRAAAALRCGDIPARNIRPSILIPAERRDPVPGFVGYGRLTACGRLSAAQCGPEALEEAPHRPENPRLSPGYRCRGCGAEISAEFCFTVRAKDIPLGGDPPAALYAAPGPGLLANTLETEIAQACDLAAKTPADASGQYL